MKTSIDYLTRYINALEFIKRQLAPLQSDMATAWKEQTRARHWGIDGIGDIEHVIIGFKILRSTKGRPAKWGNFEKTARKFYDRIQAN